MDVRVDFTPMVDMLMLLITFFMLCTTLSKPQTMELTMPSNEDVQDEKKNEAKASETITLYVAADNKIYYGEGIPQYTDPAWLKETRWGNGKEGVRDILRNHATEDGTVPVKQIELAVKKLNADKAKDPKMWPDSIFQKELSRIKRGELDSGKIPTLTVVIKPTDNASYKNMVDALDEMQILSIGTYVIDKLNDEDKQMLTSRGIRM
jgi:hypothetical protein